MAAAAAAQLSSAFAYLMAQAAQLTLRLLDGSSSSAQLSSAFAYWMAAAAQLSSRFAY